MTDNKEINATLYDWEGPTDEEILARQMALPAYERPSLIGERLVPMPF